MTVSNFNTAQQLLYPGYNPDFILSLVMQEERI